MIFKCKNRKRHHPDGTPYCTYEAPYRWLGRCPECQMIVNCEGPYGVEDETEVAKASTLAAATTAKPRPRVATGIPMIDTLTNGGFPKGAVVIISGIAGGGKTTLNLLMANGIAQGTKKVLYASAEQTESALVEIAQRLEIPNPNVELICSNDVRKIAARVEQIKPAMLFVDSIQRMYVDDVSGRPGSAEQCRAILDFLNKFCVTENIPCLVVSHITKAGEIAGPTTLEHMCEATLELDPRIKTKDGEDIPETRGYRKLTLGTKSRIGPPGHVFLNITLAGKIETLTEEEFFGKKKRRVVIDDEDDPSPKPPTRLFSV